MRINQIKGILITLAITCMVGVSVYGQDISGVVRNTLLGRWEGAFIKGNSQQSFEMEFFEKEGVLFANQVIPDWHPVFGNVYRKVEIGKDGEIMTETGNGEAVLRVDPDRLEMTGVTKNSNPAIYLHMKKVAPRPENMVIEEVKVKSGNAVISGHLHRPRYRNSKSAVIIAEGRGCYANRTDRNLYARFLTTYGASVLAFHKRGNGDSTGDCGTATIGDLATDIDALRKYLRSHSAKFEHIGVIGASAGAWVMLKASEIEPFDFLISVNGPATSVREQQYQSMVNGFQEFDLGETGRKQVAEYTDLVFDGPANRATYDHLTRLLESAEREGWMDFLDDTDKVKSVSEIDNLWVRRHGFDPKGALGAHEGPYLAIFGEKDWIVPLEENIDDLEAAFKRERRTKLTIVRAFGANHGMGIRSGFVNLSGNTTYWQFYKSSPVIKPSILRFLQKNGFI